MRLSTKRFAQDEHPVLIFIVVAALVLGSLFLVSRVVPGEAGGNTPPVTATPTPSLRSYP
jgi:hypothetical protein